MSKLEQLRKEMAKMSLDCYLCFHGDNHNSEYLAPCDERVKFISGFSGSNGLCVVTMDDARMWTDGRYYLAAGKELEAGWTMMKMEAAEISWFKWVADNCKAGSKIGLDFTQYPAAMFELRFGPLKQSGFVVESTPNLVDAVWGSDRPARPCTQVKQWETKYAGMSTHEKYAKCTEQLGTDIDCLLVTALDQIAWLLNMRGMDIEFNPVFFSNAIFHMESKSVDLFIDASHFDETAHAYLKSINVTLKPYDDIVKELQLLVAVGKKIGYDSNKCNSELDLHISKNAVKKDNIVETIKACKTSVEVAGMSAANVRDCAAIMKYFAFLEEELMKPDHGLTEFTGARKVEEYRTHGEFYTGPSFDTISSIGPNGAVIHYKPSKDQCSKLNNDEIYLLDSGGQYLDGTTDITRTGHFGGKAPTAFQKEAYTRVLMGTLDLERIVWPADCNISGADMDILARMALWRVGLDYKHGTGHGVGTFLNVHEGPQGISRGSKVKLEEGMCVSDEPGYYKDGEFGIRIENVIVCVKHPQHENHLMWRNMTVAPYCRELIDVNVLPAELRQYVDLHSKRCLQELTPHLQNDARALAYVTRQCQPL